MRTASSSVEINSWPRKLTCIAISIGRILLGIERCRTHFVHAIGRVKTTVRRRGFSRPHPGFDVLCGYCVLGGRT